VAAVAFDQGKWLDFCRQQIQTGAPFPPRYPNVDQPASRRPAAAGFPDPAVPTERPSILRTGHSPIERQWTIAGRRG
jgi:hypothetical protein